mgnify:CR=1 FL=1
MSCDYEVTPFPYEWCTGCMANGCYPWNKNPATLCMRLGGLYPPVTVKENDMDVRCLNYRKVDFGLWQAHFEDLKKEAEQNEDARLRAMQGKVMCNHPIP